MRAAALSGVVTFLFTDIEGSTRRWESDAQAMRAALAVHDKVLRTAIEAYGGFLFSHTGDGFVAAFASPTSAVNAADRAAVPDAVAAVLFITQQPGKSQAGIVGETVAPMIAAGLNRLRT
jgi:class 3 adenylate cyclase